MTTQGRRRGFGSGTTKGWWAEGRVGGGSRGPPPENFVKKTQNPAFWELLAQCAVESSTVLSTTEDA